MIGKEHMELLFEVMRADISAKNPQLADQMYQMLEAARRLYAEMLSRGDCVSLKELNLKGKDLIEAGLKPGKRIGEILNRLLEEVITRPELNDKVALMEIAKKIIADEKPDDSSGN